MLTTDQYKKEERKQTIHRSINTILSVVIVVFGFFFIKQQLTPVYEQLTGITEQRQIQSEIVQIAKDEGYRRCVYKDTRGLDTVGFGHLLRANEKYKCINPHLAVKLLRKDYTEAQTSVERRYPWADGEVKLVLINMSYNLGSTRLSKFKQTLAAMKAKDYDRAAGEMLDSIYARQVPNRAALMSVRIMRLKQ